MPKVAHLINEAGKMNFHLGKQTKQNKKQSLTPALPTYTEICPTRSGGRHKNVKTLQQNVRECYRVG